MLWLNIGMVAQAPSSHESLAIRKRYVQHHTYEGPYSVVHHEARQMAGDERQILLAGPQRLSQNTLTIVHRLTRGCTHRWAQGD